VKYIDEYRDKKLVRIMAVNIAEIMPDEPVNIMEVCGTHTQSIFKFGLKDLLPRNLNLISGPGCPVCVSDQGYIDAAIELARNKNNIILTFGDMLRVPGKRSTLEGERSRGSEVHMVYSPLDSIKFAESNPNKSVIFLAVGFETTAPAIGLTLLAAQKRKINNLSFFSALKLMPPVIKNILNDRAAKIDGLLCPGHVSSIIGSNAYRFITRKYKKACCVAGFEPLDILEGIYILIKQIINNKPEPANQYTRAVTPEGNAKARSVIRKVFKPADASWRGLGIIRGSGLAIRDEYARFDTRKVFPIRETRDSREGLSRCRCGEVIKGCITPRDCPLFKKACAPEHPYGPCMVSFEGACNAYYKYLH
jgi:hydrogenase expression/formation protein HypD